MEDMIVYWNDRGEPLARETIEQGARIKDVENALELAMHKAFGLTKYGNPKIDNTSYDFSDEW